MRVPLTTRDFLDRAELVYGDRIGIVDEPNQPAPSIGELSYRDVARRGRALQAGLDELGVGEGERVAIVSHNAGRLLESLLALPSSGRVVVPINFRLSPEEVSYIVGQSGSRVLFVDPELESSLKGVEAEHRFGTGEEYEQLLRFDTEPRPWSEPDEDATATINYTSGTTARPKGVQMTHRNEWVNAVTFGMHMQVSDRDVYLHTLPMFHCNGWGLLYTMAGLGGEAGRAAQGRRRRRSSAGSSSTASRSWPGRPPSGTPSWRPPPTGTARSPAGTRCGSSSPARRRPRARSPGWRPSSAGSSTRSTASPRPRRCSRSTGRAPSSTSWSRRSAPRACRGPASRRCGTRLTVSDSGEVLAQSNTVLAGYWENPDASAEALEGGWFHTGDGGTIDDGGYLTISDRKKDVIITGGENVSSIEVEDVVFSHPAVAEVAVIGVPDDKWGEMVTAIVVVAEGEQVTEEEIIAHCRGKIAGYKIPKRIEFRDELARTATGKIQKFKLRESFWADSERQDLRN